MKIGVMSASIRCGNCSRETRLGTFLELVKGSPGDAEYACMLME